jgi:3-methyladenine DNA glycosylase AlkD
LRAAIGAVAAEAGSADLAGLARVGIRTDRAIGVTLTRLKPLARRWKRDHELALALWPSGIREHRLLATLVDDPAAVTDDQMDDWVAGIDSWDVCDAACGLFARSPLWPDAARRWVPDEREFVRRAGFVVLAIAARVDKPRPDAEFVALLEELAPLGAGDSRNFVKKAVSWAIRWTGERSSACWPGAVAVAEALVAADGAGRWAGRDALRELNARHP